MKLPPCKHIKIQPSVVAPLIPSDLDEYVYKLQASIYAKVVDIFNEEVVKAIQEYCLKNGYTDIVRIEEAFIEAAIEHEIQRRESCVASAPIRRNDEKNLRLLNEAQGVIWHSVADELPSENGTYLVVGKSGTVFLTNFHKERKLTTPGYYTIPGHFNNRYVRFWAKLPEPPIQNQDYQTLIINNKNLRILLDRIEMVVDDIRVIAEKTLK